jgi:membrane fusion protein (multidrug efflux system)
MTRTLKAPLSWLALAPLAGLLLAGCGDSEARNPARVEPPAPVAVMTAAAQSRSLPGEIDVTGTLVADAQTEVASEGSGRVLAVTIERGSAVRAGAVLATLDSDDARNALREAEATEAQTQARLGLEPGAAFDPARTPEARKARVVLERAEAEHARYAKLVDMSAVSRSDYDLRRMEALSAREQYETTLNETRQLHQALLAQRARVAIARKALDDMAVRAPFDGLVAEKHVTVGQFLPRGARVATLVRVDPLRIELIVPESAVAAVRKGQRVSFTVQTYPDARFDGTVAYVGPSLRPDARALVAEALVPNPAGRLQPGLFATARIELPATKPTVLVPAAAVRTQAGVSSLWVTRDSRAEQRLVQLGRQVGDLVEVVRGVAAGEAVVTTFDERLTDGAPVTTAAR